MLQTHVNNDIYNKYCPIHNTIQQLMFMCIPYFKILASIVSEKIGIQKILRNYGVTKLRNDQIQYIPNCLKRSL